MRESLISQNPLHSIPQRKLENAIRAIIDSFPGYEGKSITSDLPEEALLLIDAVKRYYAANIPFDYWFLDMDEFAGDSSLLKRYNRIADDVDKVYNDGLKICLAGQHGLGKTMCAVNILKRALEAGYSALYVTLSDIVNVMTSSLSEKKYIANENLRTVDFLVIDEFDPRFMGSENAADLYGRILEPTLRARVQNKLPLIMCTNSTNVLGSFSGALKDSISSLMNLVKVVVVVGDDFRKNKVN